MSRPGDRRPLIADHAVAVLAGGGARALSHQAVDRAAGLATGSTSYYFRTRRELISAAVERIRQRSRTAFDEASVPQAITPQLAATLMESQIHMLAGTRRSDALAVFALLPETEGDPALRTQLAACLFSRELATGLFSALGGTNPDSAALDLIDFLTGLLFGLLFGQRRTAHDEGNAVAGALLRFLASYVSPGASTP